MINEQKKVFRSYTPPNNSKVGFFNSTFLKQIKKRNIITALVFLFFLYYGVFHGYFNKVIGYSNNAASKLSAQEKQQRIKDVFKESFNKYQKYAWGYDRYDPVNLRGSNLENSKHPLGWMIVDSLDTLVLMGLDEELEASRSWIKDSLDYNVPIEVSLFETTIRMLGGLLSAYYLTGDVLYYDKSIDLANRLLPAFNTASGIPYEKVNLQTGRSNNYGPSSTAEVGTLQLEFKYLAYLSNNSTYWDVVEKVMSVLYNANLPEDGLVPIQISPSNGRFTNKLIRLGSRGDSYYEYLLKQYLQTGENIYLDMHEESVEGVKRHMINKSIPNGLTFIGELNRGIRIDEPPLNKMDHLVCFYPGLLALGATEGMTLKKFKEQGAYTNSFKDLDLAKELTETCYMMYKCTKTGLAGEISMFNTESRVKNDIYILPNDRHNLQRPETVESLFYLYRITEDPIYRQWGWEIFESFVKYTKVEGGYSGINDVENPENVNFRDDMESFWLAETLKYLYLLFEDDFDVFSLEEIIFNTEAHPLPKLDLSKAEASLKTNWKMNRPINKQPNQNAKPKTKLENHHAHLHNEK